jgi:ribokinase
MSEGGVVVVGSVNADLVVSVKALPRAGETVTGGTFARHGGGKGANQAVAAARAGARVAFVGAVGNDDLGDEALRELAAEGIDVSAVQRLDDVPTGVAVIVVDERGENQIAVASGANAALTGETVRTALEPLLGAETTRLGRAENSGGGAETTRGGGAETTRGGGAETTRGGGAETTRGGGGGVVLLGHEVPAEAVAAGAKAARAAGWRVILNPAPARELIDDLDGVILTPNAEEARALTGEDPQAAARALRARSNAPVLVTMGAEGALLDGERFAAPPVDVVDTTGAGDAVNGALAARLAAGDALQDAVRFALAAASLSTRAPGARAGMPRRDDVLAAL